MCCRLTYTRRQWTLLVAMSAVTLGTSLCASLQAPFYPQEAEKKGASPTEYGLVFGIYELTSFISAPIWGRYIGRMGVGSVLKGGTMVAGCSLISFGLLDYVQDHVPFISLSLFVRVVEALATSAVVTSVLSIVIVTFTDTFATVFTVVQTFQGLGFLIGPTVGGYLFEIGGFVCPFVVIGGLVLTNGLILCAILPKIESKVDETKPRTTIFAVLKVVPIFLDAFAVMVEAINLGFLLAILEPHIRQFDLSPTALGGMFVISGVAYILLSPLVGFLCDKELDTKKMIILGSVISVISYLLIGPVPFTPFETSLLFVGIGLVLDGIGTAFIFIPAFVDAVNSAVKYGLPYDIHTYALVSGIYASSFSLGAFIGPSVSGVLYDTVGFRQGMLLVIALHIVSTVFISSFLCVQKRYDERHIAILVKSDDECARGEEGETAPLLITNSRAEPQSLSPQAAVTYNSFPDTKI